MTGKNQSGLRTNYLTQNTHITTNEEVRKKLCPSTQKRNARRRQEFLASKEASSPIDKKSKHDASVLELHEAASKEDGNVKAAPSCDICGHETKTENGIKLHKQEKHQINQIYGNSSISEEQVFNTSYEEKTTQTDVFLKIDEEGELCGPLLSELYSEPPSIVYHPVWGIGKYYITSVSDDITLKCYCYQFEDGSLSDT